ncbi:unnamed protein product [Gongylonema pulchrum]|uniref:L-Fucosyltransferase n=1 Tax=Gongylonema pulchrum TaxID=637853 RepID=A0A3P6SJM7_9BILA|nr:unnamed protein product [Gongylonema pulchrum]VDK76197.1 unnamed protein product [Gongylonema pulchrum]
MLNGTRDSDMATLSRCNHTIMTTGTFSWWAAYLTAGDVVYYKDWPRPNSELDKQMFKQDYFLKNWLPLA